MIDNIDENNYMMYAMQHYDNPACFDDAEFQNDMKRFKYLKRLFNTYRETGKLKERLILNHMTILYNVFGPEATTKLLFLKLRGYGQYLKPFMMVLSILPEHIVYGVGGEDIFISDIPLDINIIQKLRAL